MREKKQKKEERKRRKAAAKAAVARAGGEQDEENSRAPRPARKSLSDWRGKFAVPKGGGAKSSAGDVASLVGIEKVVVQKREAYGDKFYRQVSAMQHLFNCTDVVSVRRSGTIHFTSFHVDTVISHGLILEKAVLKGISRWISFAVVCGQVEVLSVSWLIKFCSQEEEFADTGYQTTLPDPGEGTAFPSSMQQLGALTAEDFNRKSGAVKEDGRWGAYCLRQRCDQAGTIISRLLWVVVAGFSGLSEVWLGTHAS